MRTLVQLHFTGILAQKTKKKTRERQQYVKYGGVQIMRDMRWG